MELFTNLDFFFLVFVITLFYFSWIFLNNVINPKSLEGTHNKIKKPPGTTGWPLFGETSEYLRTAKEGFPEKFMLDRIRKYSSNVFKTSLMGENMVMLCSAEGNKFLFSNENKLVRSWLPKTFDKIFANSGPTSSAEETVRMRKILSHFLKPDSLKSYIGIMDLMTKRHLNEYWTCHNHKDGDQSMKLIKVHPLAKKYTFALVCRLLLNIQNKQTVDKLQETINHIFSGLFSVPINFPGTKFNRAIRASSQMRKELEDLVVRRRMEILEKKEADHHRTTKDILSHLLMETYGDGQVLKDSDIANNLYGSLVAAYDNVSSTLVSIMSYLADVPQVYDRIFREQTEIANAKAPGELLNWKDIQQMRYSWNVACEVLRLFPPSPGAFKEAIDDFVYEGFLIPKGFKLHWNANATHTNPKYFPDPKKFDPSRFEGSGPVPYSYVPFGGGPRMCPGKEYVRLKILVFMHNVVKNFKWEKVYPDEKIIRDPNLIPTRGLPIRLYPHKPEVVSTRT